MVFPDIHTVLPKALCMVLPLALWSFQLAGTMVLPPAIWWLLRSRASADYDDSVPATALQSPLGCQHLDASAGAGSSRTMALPTALGCFLQHYGACAGTIELGRSWCSHQRYGDSDGTVVASAVTTVFLPRPWCLSRRCGASDGAMVLPPAPWFFTWHYGAVPIL